MTDLNLIADKIIEKQNNGYICVEEIIENNIKDDEVELIKKYIESKQIKITTYD